MNKGYILLLRKIMDTSFYKNINTCHLAIHCLLRANFKKTKLIINKEEVELSRGQFITSIEHLSNETGLSMQNTRTSLKILTNTNFLTKTSTTKMTIITIVKYDELQAFSELSNEPPNTQTNKPLTNEQQTTNKPLTTDNTYKNATNEKNRYDFLLVWNKYPNKQGKKPAERHFKSSVKSDVDFSNIQTALTNYLGCERVAKGYIQNGSTWFNDWQAWINPTPEMMGVLKTPELTREEKIQQRAKEALANVKHPEPMI